MRRATCEIEPLTIDTTERRIDAYAMEIVSTYPYSSLNRLTHRLVDVAFQCRILGISSSELLNNIRLINIVIHNINNRYDAAII